MCWFSLFWDFLGFFQALVIKIKMNIFVPEEFSCGSLCKLEGVNI